MLFEPSLIVTLELANLELAIEPANIALVITPEPITKSKVLSLSSYVTDIPVSVLEPTIAPTVSEIVSAKVVPLIVIASASSVPSISTSPDTSKVAASSSPVIVMFLAPVKSLLLSTTIALEASTVPAVATST